MRADLAGAIGREVDITVRRSSGPAGDLCYRGTLTRSEDGWLFVDADPPVCSAAFDEDEVVSVVVR